MFVKSRRLTRILLLAAVAIPFAGCGEDAVAPPPLENPSTVRVVNNLLGPVLFFRVRACGTSQWGDDLLPADPVTGRINPGEQRDFIIEAGCYDLQAQHLIDQSGPSEIQTKEVADQVASPVAILTWELTEVPGGPS